MFGQVFSQILEIGFGFMTLFKLAIATPNAMAAVQDFS
jgi:hypothetical protein